VPETSEGEAALHGRPSARSSRCPHRGDSGSGEEGPEEILTPATSACSATRFTLWVAPGRPEGATRTRAILKPMLARVRELQTIGASTPGRFRKHLRRTAALEAVPADPCRPPTIAHTIRGSLRACGPLDATNRSHITDDALVARKRSWPTATSSDRFPVPPGST